MGMPLRLLVIVISRGWTYTDSFQLQTVDILNAVDAAALKVISALTTVIQNSDYGKCTSRLESYMKTLTERLAKKARNDPYVSNSSPKYFVRRYGISS